MGYKKGYIYNYCREPKTGEYFIEKYCGWIDASTGVGYYKYNDKWRMTDIETGYRYGNTNCFNTRKAAAEYFETIREKVAERKKQPDIWFAAESFRELVDRYYNEERNTLVTH